MNELGVDQQFQGQLGLLIGNLLYHICLLHQPKQMRISPIQNSSTKNQAIKQHFYQHEIQIQQHKLNESQQQSPSNRLQQDSDCSSSDPETENESAEVQYRESNMNMQKMMIPGLEVIHDESQDIEHVGHYTHDNNQHKLSGKGQQQQSKNVSQDLKMERENGQIKKTSNRRKGSPKQKKNRRYYQGSDLKNNNNESSIIESSSSSLFSSKAYSNSPTKLSSLKRHMEPIQKKSNLKLVKRDSESSAAEVIDSRKKQLNQHECRCLKMPIQRLLTFVLIYQICIGQCIMVALIQHNFLYLIALVLLVPPTYYGILCISKANSKVQKENITQNEIYEGNSKIYNTYFMGYNQQGKQPNLQPADSFLSNNLFSQFHKDNCSRLSLGSTEQIRNKTFSIVVPYMQNNQMQRLSKCQQCDSVHQSSRIKHCHKCETCHFGYDHFCKWLYVCIDGFNYAIFFKFVTILWLLSLCFTSFSIFKTTYWAKQINNLLAVYGYQIWLMIGIWILVEVELILSLFFTSYILFYHVWLSCKGVSTRQYLHSSLQIPNNNLIAKSWNFELNSKFRSFYIDQMPLKLQQVDEKSMFEE